MDATDTTLIEYQLVWKSTYADRHGGMLSRARHILETLPVVAEITEEFGGTLLGAGPGELPCDNGMCFTCPSLDDAVNVQRVIQAWLHDYVDPRYKVTLTPGPTDSDNVADGG